MSTTIAWTLDSSPHSSECGPVEADRKQIKARTGLSPHSSECGPVEADVGGVIITRTLCSPHSSECGPVEAITTKISFWRVVLLSALFGVRPR